MADEPPDAQPLPGRDLVPGAARYAGDAEAGARLGEHVVKAWNRWSRVGLDVAGLRPEAWYALEARLGWDAEETAGRALDFAVAGFEFLAEDGSILDPDHVPGLGRTLLDPHASWIAGPACQPEGAEWGRTACVRLSFRAPAQARDLRVTIRSWRNTRPFTIAAVTLRENRTGAVGPVARRRLGPEPRTLRYHLVGQTPLVLRGQVYAGRPDEHAARVGIVYRDADGAVVPLPYPDTISLPGHGAVVNLPAQPQARRFTLDLRPPADAALIELGFGTWEDADASAPDVELMGAVEVALGDRLRLETLGGDDLLDGAAFLARLAGRLGASADAASRWAPDPDEIEAVPLALTRARSLRDGPARDPARGRLGRAAPLRLAGAAEWRLPDAPDWREDPFASVPWRLDYQSLAWLLTMAADAESRVEARRLAVSWSRANPWGQPADPLCLHPDALPLRAEVLVALLAAASDDPDTPVLLGEAARHGFALGEIVGQNTFGCSLHQMQAAAALLAVARALPRLPPSAHWASLARESLRESVDAARDARGDAAEGSPHRRLERLTLAQCLADALGSEDPGPRFAEWVAAALPGLGDCLDPAGRLPPFGDHPLGFDHGAWIGRLADAGAASAAGADRPRPAEGRPPASGDILCARHHAPGRGWGYFACTLAAPSPQGHADCTSFVFATESLPWIVEAGGSEQGEIGSGRAYLPSARAHNLAIPDGREPMLGHGRLAASVALPGARAHAVGTSIHGPDYRHVRIFVVPDDLLGLAVIDRFEASARPMAFAGLLHLVPDALLAVADPRRALAQQAGRRMSLVPWTIDGHPAGLEVINGRNDRPGTMQGFVAAPGGLRAANVLRYGFTGRGTVCGGIVMAIDGAVEDRLARCLAGDAFANFLAGV